MVLVDRLPLERATHNMDEHLAVAARSVPRRAVLDLDRHMYRARAAERLLDRHLDLGGVSSLLFNMTPNATNYRACDNAGHKGDKDGAERRATSRIFLVRQIGATCGRERLGTLRGHVENAEGCRAVGVDGVARLRGLCRRDRHVGWLAERGRSIGFGLVCLGLGPSLFEGQGIDRAEGGVRVGGDVVASLVLVDRHVTRRRLVPPLVRSLTLAVPPFKVIDIHTGRPLGLANKHLLVLYPQTARRLAGTDRKTITTFDAFPRFRAFHRML